MRKFKHLQEKEYTALKALLNAAPLTQVAGVTGRSTATLANINRSNDFNDYKFIVSSYTTKATPKTTSVEAQIVEKLEEVIELLKKR